MVSLEKIFLISNITNKSIFPINRSYSIIFVIDGLPNLWQSYFIIFFSVNFVLEYLFYTVYEKSIYHSWKC